MQNDMKLSNINPFFLGTAVLLYIASAVAVVLVLVLYLEPCYGQTNVMVYIGVCSITGSITVSKIYSF